MTRLGWVVFVVVAVSTGVAFWLEINYQLGAAASVLILSLTALLIVWYADGTRRLAASTQALAEASLRPDLIVRRPYEQASDGPGTAPDRWQDLVRSRVINKGAGPALNASVAVGGQGAIIIANVLPREGTAYDDCLGKAQKSGEIVALSCTDGAGNLYPSWWVYEDGIRNWRAAKPSEIVEREHTAS